MEFCLASSKYPNMGARSAVESVIAAYGGQSSTLCKKGMHCVVATPEDVAKDTKKIRKANKLGIVVVSDGFIQACVAAGSMVLLSPHLLTKSGAPPPSSSAPPPPPASAPPPPAGPQNPTLLTGCTLHFHAPKGSPGFATPVKSLKATATSLGADVASRFSRKSVSHVILPQGSAIPPKFASIDSAFIVSESWLTTAQSSSARPDEEDHDPSSSPPPPSDPSSSTRKRKRAPSPPPPSFAAPQVPATTTFTPPSLSGLTLCLTGKLFETRAELTKKLDAAGAQVVSKVSAGTDILVSAAPNSGTVKETDALALGIPIVNGAWLQAALSGSPPPVTKTIAPPSSTTTTTTTKTKRAKTLASSSTALTTSTMSSGGAGPSSSSSSGAGEEVVCSLAPQVQEVIKLICDLQNMSSLVIKMEYDVNKLPLGKLKKSFVKRGLAKLKEIETELKGSARRSVLSELSSDFYTLVPHAFGMKRPPIIGDEDMLEQKIQLMDALSDIQTTSKSLKSVEVDTAVHPVTARFNMLRTKMAVVDPSTETFQLIAAYLDHTHAPTHKMFKLSLMDVMEVERAGSVARFAPHASDPNRMLLWHGTRLSNMVGILRQGLRIAPPEAPVTGYMFGKGLYFADMVSKSAQYCWATKTADVGLLVLSEVALGTPYVRREAEMLDHPPSGCHSTFGEGKTRTNPKHTFVTSEGVSVPLGKPVSANLDGDSDLLYNEYVVYDEARVRIRYLCKVRFSFGP